MFGSGQHDTLALLSAIKLLLYSVRGIIVLFYTCTFTSLHLGCSQGQCFVVNTPLSHYHRISLSGSFYDNYKYKSYCWTKSINCLWRKKFNNDDIIGYELHYKYLHRQANNVLLDLCTTCHNVPQFAVVMYIKLV
jgi:hypothetical protein